MTETDIQQLKRIQQQLAEAWVARDRDTIERLVAPDWIVTHVAGQRLTRSDVLRDMLESSATRIESMTVDDVDVRLFGDTAVVTGRTHARGVQTGAAFDVTLRFTDVFVRRSDEWQAVASHATLVGT
ncbi:MAG TPA: nuclear transport factor 2 family protein [Vicinamibacterales bacterium]|jgi:ketosteroid isomerase-like protein|nr:nuclear transport factor 2 family protein [Vicinamibacterales bacterium]